jgi:hypothetical protein
MRYVYLLLRDYCLESVVGICNSALDSRAVLAVCIWYGEICRYCYCFKAQLFLVIFVAKDEEAVVEFFSL